MAEYSNVQYKEDKEALAGMFKEGWEDLKNGVKEVGENIKHGAQFVGAAANEYVVDPLEKTGRYIRNEVASGAEKIAATQQDMMAKGQDFASDVYERIKTGNEAISAENMKNAEINSQSTGAIDQIESGLYKVNSKFADIRAEAADAISDVYKDTADMHRNASEMLRNDIERREMENYAIKNGMTEGQAKNDMKIASGEMTAEKARAMFGGASGDSNNYSMSIDQARNAFGNGMPTEAQEMQQELTMKNTMAMTQ